MSASLIEWAVKSGSVPLVKRFLTACPDALNSLTCDGQPLLHLAIRFGGLDVIAFLLSHGIYVDIPDSVGYLPIHLASQLGKDDAIKGLIAAGARTDTTTPSGFTPVLIAACNGHAGAVESLLDTSSNAAIPNGLDSNTAKKDARAKSVSFIDNPWVCLTPGPDVVDAIAVAAQRGYTDVIDILCSRGASVNEQTSDGVTPLHLACCEGHVTTASALLRHGAKVNAAIDVTGRSSLHIACSNNQKEMVDMLLQHGADVEAGDSYGDRALHIAVTQGSIHIVSRLLELGAEPEATNTQSRTALHLASQLGERDIVIRLLERSTSRANGLNVIGINVGDVLGNTAIHLAADNGHSVIAILLILHGGDPNAKNRAGDTPVHLAARRGDEHMTTVLLSHGGCSLVMNSEGSNSCDVAKQAGAKECLSYLRRHEIAPCCKHGNVAEKATGSPKFSKRVLPGVRRGSHDSGLKKMDLSSPTVGTYRHTHSHV